MPLVPLALALAFILTTALVLGLLLAAPRHRLGLLSAPGPFQQFAFEQPNVALQHFPYVWLAAFMVPAVLLVHVAVLWQLMTGKIEAKAAA